MFSPTDVPIIEVSIFSPVTLALSTLTRAVNLPCESGGSAERMNIKYAVGHGTRRDLCVVGTIEGQMTLKTKVNIFGFLKTCCSIEGICRYSLVH